MRVSGCVVGQSQTMSAAVITNMGPHVCKWVGVCVDCKDYRLFERAYCKACTCTACAI